MCGSIHFNQHAWLSNAEELSPLLPLSELWVWAVDEPRSWAFSAQPGSAWAGAHLSLSLASFTGSFEKWANLNQVKFSLAWLWMSSLVFNSAHVTINLTSINIIQTSFSWWCTKTRFLQPIKLWFKKKKKNHYEYGPIFQQYILELLLGSDEQTSLSLCWQVETWEYGKLSRMGLNNRTSQELD